MLSLSHFLLPHVVDLVRLHSSSRATAVHPRLPQRVHGPLQLHHEPLQHHQHPPSSSTASSSLQPLPTTFLQLQTAPNHQQPPQTPSVSFIRSRSTPSTSSSTSDDAPAPRRRLQSDFSRDELLLLTCCIDDVTIRCTSAQFHPSPSPPRLELPLRHFALVDAHATTNHCSFRQMQPQIAGERWDIGQRNLVCKYNFTSSTH